MATMNRFAYADATTVEDVVAALSEECRPLAGGTDLLGLMKEGIKTPERLVNVKTLQGLDEMQLGEGVWRVGALVTLSQLRTHPALQEREDVRCLVESITVSASPQLRHRATIAGNLVQQPRCWYYRNPHVPCWRKGGQRCFAVRGENKYHTILGLSPCNAVHPSDPAVALLVLDASVRLAGPTGTRVLKLEDFYRLPDRSNRNATQLGVQELITEVTIPAQPQGMRSVYVKKMERQVWDFALVSVAAGLVMEGDRVEQARIALGGVACTPWRATGAEEALVGQPLTAARIAAAAEAAVADARPMEDNAYKMDMLRASLREALRHFM